MCTGRPDVQLHVRVNLQGPASALESERRFGVIPGVAWSYEGNAAELRQIAQNKGTMETQSHNQEIMTLNNRK